MPTLKKIKYENVLKMKKKHVPALLRTSNLLNEIIKRDTKISRIFLNFSFYHRYYASKGKQTHQQRVAEVFIRALRSVD
jgi:hypothetical protein